MAKDAPTPATPSAEYDYMAPQWAKIDTVLQGTEAMRAAGEVYLPRHEGESKKAYAERRNCNVLVNYAQFTLDTWCGKPFNKPVRIGDDVPPEIVALLDNIDMEGNNLTVFAREWFKDGLAKGFSHVLAEFPHHTQDPKRTLADDRAENLRPYLVHVPPEQLLFAYAESQDGRDNLLHVRLAESRTELLGYVTVSYNQIKLIEPGLVTIYEERKDFKTRKPKWVQVDQYSYPLNFIPLVTFYTARQGFMIAKPPMMDLVDLNIRHWQSTSDQIAILTVTRFPILAVSGAMSNDDLTIGPNEWVHVSDPSGRIYYVEHSGRAVNTGRQDLMDLEETMSQYGATFLRRRPGGTSATSRTLDTAETTSPLQDMAIRFSDSLNQIMQFLGNWIDIKDAGSYTITTDFGLSDEGGKKLDILIAARTAREISHNQFIQEMLRFDLLRPDFDTQKNDEELAAEPKPEKTVTKPVVLNDKMVVDPNPPAKPAPTATPAK